MAPRGGSFSKLSIIRCYRARDPEAAIKKRSTRQKRRKEDEEEEAEAAAEEEEEGEGGGTDGKETRTSRVGINRLPS